MIKQSKAHLTEVKMSYGEHWLHVLEIVCALLIHAAIPALLTDYASARISETPEERLLRKGAICKSSITRQQRLQLAILDVCLYIGVVIIVSAMVAGLAMYWNHTIEK